MTIAEMSAIINANARAKGFWDSERNLGEMLCLIHSEISEALEADRKDRRCAVSIRGVSGWFSEERFLQSFQESVKDTFEDELADAVIRIFDLAYARNIDLAAHIVAKHRFNTSRERMHGKKY